MLLGIEGITGYVWFAFAGAAIAAVTVYALGTAGRSGATPVRLAPAGVAVAASLTAYSYGVALSDAEMLQRFNAWVVGSLAGRDAIGTWRVAPFLIAGIVLALALARPLNAIALGDDAARSLGARLGRTRVAGALVGIMTGLTGGAYLAWLLVAERTRGRG